MSNRITSFGAVTSTESFKLWLANVDACCARICGLSIHDLPDCCFMDWFEDGVTPTSAARRAIRNANDE